MAVTVERLVAEVEANPAGAIAALQAFDTATDRAARDRHATITVETNQAELDALARALDDAGSGGRRGGEGLSFFSNNSNNANIAASGLRMVLMGGLGLPAVAGLAIGAAGALQTLGAAAVGATSAVAGLVGVLGAVPVGLGAVVGGLGATIMGFQGIGGAIKATDVVMGSSPISTGQAANSTRAVEGAVRGLESAYRSLGKAQEGVKRAQRDLARAHEDAAEMIASAEEAAADRVAAARERAAGSGERVEDAQFRVADALLSEKEAVLALEAAQKRLADVQSNVGKTSTEMSRVTDDFTGKTYEVARISNDAADSQYDQQEAILAVQRAQLALLKAQDEVGDSQRDMTKAAKEHAEAPAMIAKAEREAAKDIAKARKNAARSIESAEERVKNAHEAVADALRGVEDAQRAVTDAQKAGAAAAAGGMAALNKYNQAMAALTPEGREFVDFMVKEFLPAWRDLQKEAQRGLLPGVMSGLRSLMTVFPMLEGQIFDFAKTVGDHFAEFFSHFAETENVEKLERVLTGLNEVLGGSKGPDGKEYQGILDAFIPLYDIILSILEAATPMTKLLTDDIVTGLENVAATLNTDEGLAKLEGWFDKGYHFGGLFMDVLRPMGTVLGDVMEAAEPLATWMLEELATYFEDLADVTSGDGMSGMAQFFEDMKQPIKETIGLIEDLLQAIFGAPTDPEDSAYLDLVKGIREDVIPEIEGLIDTLATSDLGAALSEFFGNIVGLIGQLAEHEGALLWVIDGINGLADAFKWLDKNTDGKSTDVLLGLFAGLGALKFASLFAKITGLSKLFKGIGWLFGLGSKGKHAEKGGILAKFFSGMKKVGAKILPWIGRFAKRFVMFLGPVGMGIGIALLVYDIIKNWDKIKEWTGKALAWLGEKIPEAWSWITTKTGEAWGWIWGKIVDAWNWIKNTVSSGASAVWGWIVEKWNWIKTKTGEAWDWVKTKVSDIWSGIKNVVSGGASAVWNWVKEKWDWIKTKTSDIWNWVNDKISGIWESIKTSVSGAASSVWNWVKDTWDDIKTNTREAWDSVWNTVKGIWDDIEGRINEFFDFVGGMKDTVTDKAAGAFDGIKEAFKTVFNWIITKWNNFGFTIPSVEIMGQKFGGYSFSTPDIPLWRQFGGPVEEGKPYIVGEKRAEMFIPNTSGRIAAAVPRTGAMSTGGGITEEQLERVMERVLDRLEEKGDVNIEQNFHEKVDPLQVSRAVARAVKV